MDAAPPDLLAALVRITARTSAVIFAAALAAGAAELVASPSSSFWRRGAGWKLIGALIVSHTIHFGFVAALAIETHGQNVVSRGGWFLTSVVGIMFYFVTVGALVLRRAPPASRTIRNVAGDTACSILVALAFLEIYLAGAGQSRLFAVMGTLLVGALLAFVVAAGVNLSRRSVPRPTPSAS